MPNLYIYTYTISRKRTCDVSLMLHQNDLAKLQSAHKKVSFTFWPYLTSLTLFQYTNIFDHILINQLPQLLNNLTPMLHSG